MSEAKLGAKERIVREALNLFAKKGFTETSVREIAEAVGIRASSLYSHFESKASILDYLLDDYKQYVNSQRPLARCWKRLTQNATAEDIMACLTLYFPEGEADYYRKMVVMLFQEQCRNETVREFMTKDMILWYEKYITDILNRLVEVGALCPSMDIAFWASLYANINYSSMARYVLGIGEEEPDFKGKRMEDMKRTLYETIFRLHGIRT